ncbi:MAG: DNA-3-methyladenine glycosylase [Candidatus Nanopelagicales bacterium]
MSPRWLLASPDRVAPRLLGARLVSEVDGERVEVTITEVEAYGGVGQDPGSHAFRGMTPRNATMFGPAGRAYVYFTYGMHWCANVVTGREGAAAAVLLRAGEVTAGVEAARARRPTSRTDRDLARGPARLTAALGISGLVDGADLLDPASPLRLLLRRTPMPVVAITPRTGVGGAGAPTPWRFVADSPTVSPYRPSRPRVRKDDCS